jgi:hypothetical protein
LPTANGRAMVTGRCGPSLPSRPGSSSGDPIMKLPAGTTTISGHSGQSRNTRPGVASSGAGAASAFFCGSGGCF